MSEPLIVSIVDDDEDVRFALEALFASCGHQPTCFESAESFLSSPSVETSDCLISDIQMPGLNGLDLVDELRARRIKVPVILISAFAFDPVRNRAREVGAHSLLEKPFAPEALMRQVLQATGRQAEAA